jgi:Zn-dependent protease with chaperone function
MVVAGWRSAAVLLGSAYLISNFLWGGVLGINRGIAANLFQLIFFLLSLFGVLIHLRRRIPAFGILLSPAFDDLAERSQRAIRAMRTPPPSAPPMTPATKAYPNRATHSSVTSHRSPLPAGAAASGLYLLTLVVEGVAALVRSGAIFFLSLTVLSPLYLFLFWVRRDNYWGPQVNLWGAQTGQFGVDYGAWLLDTAGLCLAISAIVGLGLGYLPVLRSLFHVIFPFTRSGAGPQEREAMGARKPTRAEHQKIINALQVIIALAPAHIRVAAPSHWLVLDAPTPDAYTLGSTVFLSRKAIEESNLVGVIAHELGHIAHQDGDLVLAMRRFVIPLAYFVGVDRQFVPAGAVIGTGSSPHVQVIRNEDEKIFYRFQALQIKFWLAFWCGGLGLFLLGAEWARFWRARDFLADDYVVQLGQSERLIALLKNWEHVDVAQPFLLTNRPYTAERLDRLQG